MIVTMVKCDKCGDKIEKSHPFQKQWFVFIAADKSMQIAPIDSGAQFYPSSDSKHACPLCARTLVQEFETSLISALPPPIAQPPVTSNYGDPDAIRRVPRFPTAPEAEKLQGESDTPRNFISIGGPGHNLREGQDD